MLQFVLSVSGADWMADLAEIDKWLADEPELRRAIVPRHRPPGPGELGPVADALAVAVGGGGTLTVLARSLKTFLSQPRGQRIELKITRPDGSVLKVTVEGARNLSVQDLAELIRAAHDEE
jgi:hypothetical protein